MPREYDRAVGAGVACAARAAMPAQRSPPGSAFASPGTGSGGTAVVCAASSAVLAPLGFTLSKPWPLAGTRIITCTLTGPQAGCHPTQAVLVFRGRVSAQAATAHGPGGHQGGARAPLLRHREPQWCGVWPWGSLH